MSGFGMSVASECPGYTGSISDIDGSMARCKLQSGVCEGRRVIVVVIDQPEWSLPPTQGYEVDHA